MARGVFITLEGGEGSGKSTQIKLLATALAAVGQQVVVTREPGGAPGAEQIRALLVDGPAERWDPVTEALLHYAARREHLRQTVVPALESGKWVLCDRFADSTMAYQGYGHGLGRDWVSALHQAVVPELTPDLTLILDMPVEEGLARAASRGSGGDRYERMDQTFHHRLREGFLDIARREPDRCAVVDASSPIDEVQAAIRQVVHTRLGVEVA